MTDIDKYTGTGDEIGRIDLGEIGDIVVQDDGYSDKDAVVRLNRDGDTGQGTLRDLTAAIVDVRIEKGDHVVEAVLASDGGDDDDTDFEVPQRPAFKCDNCNRTWPRTKNQTPTESEDICPECHDG